MLLAEREGLIECRDAAKRCFLLIFFPKEPAVTRRHLTLPRSSRQEARSDAPWKRSARPSLATPLRCCFHGSGSLVSFDCGALCPATVMLKYCSACTRQRVAVQGKSIQQLRRLIDMHPLLREQLQSWRLDAKRRLFSAKHLSAKCHVLVPVLHCIRDLVY